jgi:hypothetical protein
MQMQVFMGIKKFSTDKEDALGVAVDYVTIFVHCDLL